LVIVVGQPAPNIESAARANQGIDPIAGKVRVSVEELTDRWRRNLPSPPPMEIARFRPPSEGGSDLSRWLFGRIPGSSRTALLRKRWTDLVYGPPLPSPRFPYQAIPASRPDWLRHQTKTTVFLADRGSGLHKSWTKFAQPP
jgi:hypothetical protein